MRADAERLCADTDAGPAKDEVIDGVPVRAIVKNLEIDYASGVTDYSRLEALYVERISLWLIPGSLYPLPPVGGEVGFRGQQYAVELSQSLDTSDRLILTRYAS